MNSPAPGVPGEFAATPPRRGPRPLRLLLAAAVTAACCLAAAIVSGVAARAELTRPATPGELSSAAATAVGARWRTLPAGRVFPARLGYSTDLLTQETANRVGMSSVTACPAAVDAALDRVARRDGCRAGVRASYADELQGVVFTIGVLAFGSARGAMAFARQISGAGAGVGVRALAFPGTASAAFGDGARQASTVTHRGPYVVLTAAGYADGRPAAATGQHNSSVFAPAAQLAAQIIGPLAVPVQVDCADRLAWSC